LQFRRQTPLETRDEPLLEIRDFRRWTIARKDDLFVTIVQSVKSMKELFLRAFLAGKELDVIDQQHVRLTVTFAEFDERAVLNRVDEIVRKSFARNIDDLHVFAAADDVLTDRVHEVRFAETDAAVNEKRVVSAGRRL